MVLGYFKDNQEIFRNCVLHWDGVSETNLGFPVLPDGVTVTPAGTWANPVDLGTNTVVKTFDGSTNYISLTDVASWTIFEGDFTIGFWVRFGSVSATRSLLGQQITSGSSEDFWYLEWVTANRLYIMGSTGGNRMFEYYCSFAPVVGTWYHVVVQRSGTSCLMYIDKVPKTVTIVQAWSGTTDIAQPLSIGRSYTTYHNGQMKDLLIYKARALSLPEITMVMAKTNPVSGNGLRAVYPGCRSVE